MKKYTVGIIFDQKFENILLILKNRPEHLKGTYNGPGGRFEDEDRDCYDCIVREVREECLIETSPSNWRYCGVLESSDQTIDFLTISYQGAHEDAVTSTDEDVSWISLSFLPANLSKNLDWIIPRALEVARQKENLEPFNGQLE